MNQVRLATFDDVLPVMDEYGLFSSICSISAPTQAVDSIGQVDLSDYTQVAGLQNIACMMATLSLNTPFVGSEKKTQQQTMEDQPFHVLLSGYYPQILQRYMATIDGVQMDILAVEHASQHTFTRLAVTRYSL